MEKASARWKNIVHHVKRYNAGWTKGRVNKKSKQLEKIVEGELADRSDRLFC